MASSRASSINKIAFVGNIPLEATITEMKAICAQVGPVTKFTICYNAETGKSKGYGFCEYNDQRLVACAIDLLHGFEHGGKKLYVRRANQEIDFKKEAEAKKKKKTQKSNTSNNHPANNNNPNAIDEVKRVVLAMSTLEKKAILNEVKGMIERNEENAKNVFLENPQLCQALLYIFMDFNWLSLEDVGHLTKPVMNGACPSDQEIEDGDDEDAEMKTMETVNDTDKQSYIDYDHDDEKENQMELPGMQQPNGSANGAVEKQQEVATADPDPLSKIPAEHQSILKRILKLNAEELAKLPMDQQKQINNIKEKLAQRQRVN